MSDIFQQYLDAGQITAADGVRLNAVVDMFKTKWDIELTMNNAATFFAHLIIAIGRVNGKETAPELTQTVVDEVRAAPAYFTCVEAVDDIEDCLNMTFPDTERGYFYLHLNQFFNDCSC
ncbi:MAG: PRD domain-containing protein [Negativicutes bacterium]|jgi:transcriptional regulatory protein LevR